MKSKTAAIHAGLRNTDRVFGSVSPPIYPSSTFIFPTTEEGARRFAGKSEGMVYSRFTNPTVSALQERLAVLEGAEAAVATSSGMAAIMTLLFHMLKSGDTVVAHRVLYGGTIELMSRILPRYGITVRLIDATSPQALTDALDDTVKLIYLETPTNPMLEIIDLQQVSSVARARGILTAVDSTFAPSPIQQSLTLGIDVVIYSLTKYHGGHSDAVGGAIIGSEQFIRGIMAKTYPFFGPTMSPFTAFLILRGIATLEVRYEAVSKSAMHLAEFLSYHQAVSRVYYPGLPDHPGHDVAVQQMTAFGGVVAFEMRKGYEAAKTVADSIKLFSLAVSLGGVESLIEHPASMTHSELTEEEFIAAGIRPGLIRIAVGLEDRHDLQKALEKAMDTV